MAWRERDDLGHDFRCGRNRACPWCHCRKVVRLYRRLLEGPCALGKAGSRLLVMAKVRFDDEFVEGADPEILTRDRVGWIYGKARSALLDYARVLGIRDGLVCHQVGPVLADVPEGSVRSFRREIGVLGEVAFEGEGGWDRARHAEFRRRAGFPGPEAPARSWSWSSPTARARRLRSRR